jgi:hypothetical protein
MLKDAFRHWREGGMGKGGSLEGGGEWMAARVNTHTHTWPRGVSRCFSQPSPPF